MKKLIITFSSALIIGTLLYTWQVIIKLRATEEACIALSQRRSDLTIQTQRIVSQLADLQKSNGEIQARLDKLKQPRIEPAKAPDIPLPADRQAARRAFEKFVLDHPDVRQAMIANRRTKTAIVYGPLFKALKLSPEQIEKFKDLMVRTSEIGLEFAAVEQATKTTTPESLKVEAKQEINSSLTELLGPEGFKKYTQYTEVSRRQDEIVSAVAGDLATSEIPLSTSQAEKLTQVLADSSSLYLSSGIPSRESTDWDRAIASAQSVLTPEQLEVFKITAQSEQATIQLNSRLDTWSTR